MDWEKIKQEFRDYVLGNWSFKRIMLIIAFSILFWIPCYNIMTAKIPPANELKKTSGIIFFEYTGSRDISLTLGLRTLEDSTLFTCHLNAWHYSSCGWANKIRDQIEGKQGTVLWYDQTIIPFVRYRNVIVELWVNEEKIVGRESLKHDIDSDFTTSCIILTVSLVIFICLDLNTMRIRQRRKKKSGELEGHDA